jgi:glycosyltransferase involved in cell wall biosynthesis
MDVSKDDLPLITICVPVKDEAYCIRHMLKSLEDLDYPKKRIKIVFVEGHSTDGTYDILAEWVARAKTSYYDVVLMRVKSNIPPS